MALHSLWARVSRDSSLASRQMEPINTKPRRFPARVLLGTRRTYISVPAVATSSTPNSNARPLRYQHQHGQRDRSCHFNHLFPGPEGTARISALRMRRSRVRLCKVGARRREGVRKRTRRRGRASIRRIRAWSRA